MKAAADPTRRLLARLSRRRETELQRAVLSVFRGFGIVMWKQNRERAGRRYAPNFGFPGLPDLGGVLPGGRGIYVEVKRPGEKPTPIQTEAMRMLAQQGAFVCVVRDVEEARHQAATATHQRVLR